MTTFILNDELSEIEPKQYAYNVASLVKCAKNLYRSEFKYLDVNHTHNLGVTGLIGLLSKAYSNHLNVSISPNDIWALVTSQLKEAIKKHPESWRHMFTDSDEKEEISVQSSSLESLPTDIISNILREKVKFDASILFPEFSTFKSNYERHLNNLFLDISSPYYSYTMFCCGIRSVKLTGQESDWEKIVEHAHGIFQLFYQDKTDDLYDAEFDSWKDRTISVLENLLLSFKKPDEMHDWMKDIFTQKNIGSGPELEINGWISSMYYFQPRIKKIENFSTDLAVVDYKNLTTGKEFTMVSGGLSYATVDSRIELVYQEFVYEKIV